MLKVLIKYTLILTCILMLIRYIIFIPVLNSMFEPSVLGIIRIASIGGTMLFAINDFLRHHNQSKKYDYGMGFTISFSVAFFALLFHYAILIFINHISGGSWDISIILNLFSTSLVTPFILALIIPATFKSYKNKEGVERDDILDEIE